MCYIYFQKKWLFPTRKQFFERDQEEESQQHLNRCTWFPNMLAKFHITHGSLYTHGLLNLLWSLVHIWKMLMNRSRISQLMFLLDTWTGQITLRHPISHGVPKEVAEFTSLIFIPWWRARCWMKGQSKKSPLYVTKMFGFTSCICENQVTKSSFCKEKKVQQFSILLRGNLITNE